MPLPTQRWWSSRPSCFAQSFLCRSYSSTLGCSSRVVSPLRSRRFASTRLLLPVSRCGPSCLRGGADDRVSSLAEGTRSSRRPLHLSPLSLSAASLAETASGHPKANTIATPSTGVSPPLLSEASRTTADMASQLESYRNEILKPLLRYKQLQLHVLLYYHLHPQHWISQRFAHRVLWGLWGLFAGTLAALCAGTYVIYSWNVMEPITYVCGCTLLWGGFLVARQLGGKASAMSFTGLRHALAMWHYERWFGHTGRLTCLCRVAAGDGDPLSERMLAAGASSRDARIQRQMREERGRILHQYSQAMDLQRLQAASSQGTSSPLSDPIKMFDPSECTPEETARALTQVCRELVQLAHGSASRTPVQSFASSKAAWKGSASDPPDDVRLNASPPSSETSFRVSAPLYSSSSPLVAAEIVRLKTLHTEVQTLQRQLLHTETILHHINDK